MGRNFPVKDAFAPPPADRHLGSCATPDHAGDLPLSQPSLRITRLEDGAEEFAFDVWNPAAAAYEPAASFEAAITRVSRLAQDMRELWISRDSKLASLSGPPAPAREGEFAELRVTSQAQRHYDIRSFDQPEWTHFRGYIAQAAERICGEVGYVPPAATIPVPPPPRMQSKSA